MNAAEGFTLDPDGTYPIDLTGAGHIPVAQAINLVPNPSFEYDTVGATPTGWTTGGYFAAGGTITCQSTSPLYGSHVMRLVSGGTAAVGAVGALSGTFYEGETYTFSGYLRGSVGGEHGAITLGSLSDNTGTVTETLTTGWQFFSGTWTPSADRTGVMVGVENVNSSQTIYADGILVTKGTRSVPYFDGDTAGYHWTGTAGNSTSAPIPGWGSLKLAALTIPPAPKRPEWASNADTDGQALVRNPLHDNRSCTMQVRVNATNMDDAMAAIGALEGKLQEACIQGANNGPGLKCNWTPAGATNTLSLYMVYGEITDLPVTYDDGWFANRPVVTVAFQCKPFLYGAELTGPTASGTTPLLTVEVDSVPGDVHAEARLVVTDGTAQPRRWVEWGLEQQYYDATDPAALFIDSGSLVTSGYAGAGTALTGAYGGSAVSASLFSQGLALCSTGSLSHVGGFRVKARIHATSANEYWRLSWQSGDDDFTSNDWAQPISGTAFSEIDLGIVTVQPVAAGTQAWSGRIEAYTTTAGGELGAVDYISLIPTEEYGRIEAAYSYEPGVITGHDEFTTLGAGTVLNARVAPTGGTWTTSGATTDFVGATGGVSRTTTSDSDWRYAILGTSSTTDTEVGVTVSVSSEPSGVLTTGHGLVARWTDSSNHVKLRVDTNNNAIVYAELDEVILGGAAELDVADFHAAPIRVVPFSLRLITFASGRVLAWILDGNGNTLHLFQALSTNLATGGALASGKAGFVDNSEETATRLYSNFYRGTPSREPLAINSGKSLEIRSDSNLRESSDGTTYGDISSRGGRLFIPQAGDAGRASRIAVRAVREDPVTMVSRNDGDSTELAVFYTPRYLSVPRS